VITLTDYWMGRDKKYPPSPDIRTNAMGLLVKVNELLDNAAAAGAGGLTGTGTGIVDGTVTWGFIGILATFATMLNAV